MTSGATRAGEVPEVREDVHREPAAPVEPVRAQVPAIVREPRGDAGVAIALALGSAAWLALAGWGAATAMTGRVLNAAVIASWASVALAPLALPLVLWTAWLRRPARMRRFNEAGAAELRREAMVLDHLLSRLAARTSDAREQLAQQAALLRTVGDETGTRIAAVGETLRNGSTLLARHAAQLDNAAETARTDLGVLIADLPEAERRVSSLIDRVHALGAEADAQGAALGVRVGGMATQQQALQGTAAELARTLDAARTRTQALTADLTQAGEALQARVGAAASLAVDGMEAVRAGGAAQVAALSGLLDQTRAAVDTAGAEALASLRRRAAACVAEVEAIGRALEVGDEAARALTAGITQDLAELEARQVVLGDSGLQRARAMKAATAEVTAELERLTGVIAASDLAGGAAIARADGLHAALDRTAEVLVDGLPALLVDAEARVGQLVAGVGSAAASVQELEQRLAGSDLALAPIGERAERTLADVEAAAAASRLRLTEIGETAAALAESIAAADAQAERFAAQAGPQLLEALVRVREAATQAAERAREALASAIRPVAASLQAETRAAFDSAVADALADRAPRLAEEAERALMAASTAGEQIEQRLLALNVALDRADARIADGLQAAEDAGDNSFPRRMTLLIESLNSTAIDVAKVLSNEVTDTAWAAYLKGDRGVFARRAVRLLDAGEAREIVRHYESDREFRAQVDRYIHDFEAMLRDVLAFRPGTPVGVTLLSSDVGKLYVALAQAIERLRT